MVTFEDIFIHCLGSAERLKFYIDNNIDLATYVREKYQPYIRLAKLFMPNRQNIAGKARDMDYQKVLDILFRKRADLWQLIMDDENGISWLKAQDFGGFLRLFEVG